MENKISLVPKYQICVDGRKDGNMTGRLYCGCLPEGKLFGGVEELLLMVDRVMDDIKFPQSTVDKRLFSKRNVEPKKFRKKDREVLLSMRKFDTEGQKGEKATFILEVQFRQNASWQGNIRWVEKQETMHFRSALEMIKLMDSVTEAGGSQAEKDTDESVGL
ncbi:MAG: hypothetical protein RR361_08985 [Anaerovorax sp.]